MSKNYIKNLKHEIKRLKEENQFLQVGISSREEAQNYVSEQLDKQMALTQEVTFLLVYMEAVEALLKDDLSTNAKTIKRAITKFKMELTDGFAANHLILQFNNNDINEIQYEQEKIHGG